MRRRDFIAGLGSAAVWPIAAHAQQGDRVRRIGVLMAFAESDPVAQARLSALVRGLRELGWTEGRNLRIEFRGIASGGIDRIRAAAAELVASNPDLLWATTTPIVQELQRQTRTIPIVFASIGDPVDTSIVGSLARPGGNATGFSNWEPAMGGKRLALLKEVAPSVNRVFVMVNSGSDSNQHELRAIEAAASTFGVYVSSAAVSDASEIERAMEVVARESKAGLIITPGIPINDLRKLIIALAGRYRLPAVYTHQFFVVEGGLMSYGPDEIDIYRRSAAYVDRILKSENPGDLPVVQPTKFGLVINLKTAKALGLTFPETLLATADEVIQ
jgi:putative tryptophan/tyrosine transport system substrate-binding protein